MRGRPHNHDRRTERSEFRRVTFELWGGTMIVMEPTHTYWLPGDGGPPIRSTPEQFAEAIGIRLDRLQPEPEYHI